MSNQGKKLSDQVRERIWKLAEVEGLSSSIVSERLNISTMTVSRVVREERRHHMVQIYTGGS
jgi:DNA-binding transcriptional regulator LsrR (DeoR family)